MVDDTVARILARTIEVLQTNGVHDEALATYKPPRRLVGIPLAASMKSAGRAWRLGVLLLDREATCSRSGASRAPSNRVARR